MSQVSLWGSFCTLAQWGGAEVESVILTVLTWQRLEIGVLQQLEFMGLESQRGELWWGGNRSMQCSFLQGFGHSQNCAFQAKIPWKLVDSSYQELNGKKKGRSSIKLENVQGKGNGKILLSFSGSQLQLPKGSALTIRTKTQKKRQTLGLKMNLNWTYTNKPLFLCMVLESVLVSFFYKWLTSFPSTTC